MRQDDKVLINAPVTIHEKPSEIRVPVTIHPPNIVIKTPDVNVSSPTVNVSSPSVTINPPDISVTSPAITINEGAVTVNVSSCCCGSGGNSGPPSPPVVSYVFPNYSPAAGGGLLIIGGSGFEGTSSVLFGTTPATAFVVNNPNQITTVIPALGVGTYDLTVTTPLGVSPVATADKFYCESTPTVTTVSPLGVPLTGYVGFVITGTGFIGATGVTIGGTNVLTYSVASPTQIIATLPSKAGGTYHTVVTTPIGTSPSTSADQVVYQAVPTVTSVSPLSSPLAGGSGIIITGTLFTGASAVTVGGIPVTSYVVNSPTQITATIPAMSAGTYDFVVTTPSGTSATSSADQIVYQAVSTVTSLTPNNGVTTGATSVVLAGTNFIGASVVNFGATPAASFVVNSAIQITAVSPAEAAATINVTVVTPSGTSATSAGNQYTFAAPAIGVGQHGYNVSNAAVASATATWSGYGGNTTAGSNLIAVVVVPLATTVTPPAGFTLKYTDALSSTYNVLTYLSPANASVANSVFGMSPNSTFALYACEVTNPTSALIDIVDHATGAGTSATAGATGVLGHADEVIISIAVGSFASGALTSSWAAPFAGGGQVFNTSPGVDLAATQLAVTATTTQTPTATFSTASPWTARTITLY